MDEVIKVKEEPLDCEYDCADQQQCQDILQGTSSQPLLPKIKLEEELFIKTELTEDALADIQIKNESNLVDMEHMQVVDEQPDIITVNAFDSKSEDEKKFIKSMEEKKNLLLRRKNKKAKNFEKTCPKCLQIFNHRQIYEQHVSMGLCAIFEQSEKCSACPLSFSSKIQLQDHLALHKLNRYFCGKHCGRSFESIDDCEMHEFKDHPIRNIFCSICNHKFSTCKDLAKHLQSHSLLRRFVCSFCRKWFSCSIDLAKHWQVNEQTCGQLMQDIVRDTIAAIESTLPVFKSSTAVTEKKIRNKKKAKNVTSPYEPSLKRSKLAAGDIKEQNGLSNSKASSFDLSFNDVKIKDEPKLEDDMLESKPNNKILIPELRNVKKELPTSNKSEIQTNHVPIDGSNFHHNLTTNSAITNAILPLPNLVPRPNFLSQTLGNGGSVILPASATLPSITNVALPPTTNIRLVRLPSLQPATVPPLKPSIATMPNSPIVKPLQLQNQNIKIAPINLKGFKIYKIMPNAKLLPLPVKCEPHILDNALSPAKAEGPIVLKLKNPPTPPAAFETMNATPLLLNINPEATANFQTILPNDGISPTKPAITLQLNSLAKNTTIDAEDLKKLVNEAAVRVNSRSTAPPSCMVARQTKLKPKKIESKSRSELHLIESLPQKRELIENLKQQIKSIEVLTCKREEESNGNPMTVTKFLNNSDTEDYPEDDEIDDPKPLIIDEHADSHISSDNEDFEFSSNVSSNSFAGGEESSIGEPPSFVLPITTDYDSELARARKLYAKDFRYAWLCPKCPRCYGQKHAFRGHLVSVHGFCKEEFNQLMIHVKPIPCTKSLEEIEQEPLAKSKIEPDTIVKETIQELETETASTNPPIPARPGTRPGQSRKSHNKFTCAKCGRSCSTRTALNDHVAANCSREPQYPCTSCPKKFYSASTLNSHLSIHTGDLPHKCSYCEKRFRTRGQVTVHHRTHTGERPFACQVCHQRFTHRETLISHLSRHIGMKRYKCYCCNQQFSCISGLKTHREVRYDTCGKVKLNTRAIGPRVRVIKGNVIFEEQPEINPYLRTEDPEEVLSEINQNTKTLK